VTSIFEKSKLITNITLLTAPHKNVLLNISRKRCKQTSTEAHAGPLRDILPGSTKRRPILGAPSFWVLVETCMT